MNGQKLCAYVVNIVIESNFQDSDLVDMSSHVCHFKKMARSIFSKFKHKVHPSMADVMTLKKFSDPDPEGSDLHQEKVDIIFICANCFRRF